MNLNQVKKKSINKNYVLIRKLAARKLIFTTDFLNDSKYSEDLQQTLFDTASGTRNRAEFHFALND